MNDGPALATRPSLMLTADAAMTQTTADRFILMFSMEESDNYDDMIALLRLMRFDRE